MNNKPIKHLILIANLLLTAGTTFTATGEPDLISQGNRLWNENKLDEAEKTYRLAIKQSPDDVSAYTRLANLYLTRNHISEAIPLFKNAITLSPEDPKLFAGLSLAYLHQQEYSKANAMASQAMVLDPDLKQAKKLLEYIELKKEVLAQTDRAMINDQSAMPDAGMKALDGKQESSPSAPAMKMHREK